jgi:Putative phage serine protease XkdF
MPKIIDIPNDEAIIDLVKRVRIDGGPSLLDEYGYVYVAPDPNDPDDYQRVHKEESGLIMGDVNDFQVEGQIAKTNDEQQIVFGWAYVTHDKEGVQQVDKSGEMISDPTHLEKAAYEFVVKSRVGGDVHIKKGVSTLVESIVFTKEKKEALGLKDSDLPTGWWVGFKVTDDEVWKAYKSGKRSSFSVHGKGLRKKVEVESA